MTERNPTHQLPLGDQILAFTAPCHRESPPRALLDARRLNFFCSVCAVHVGFVTVSHVEGACLVDAGHAREFRALVGGRIVETPEVA